MKLNSFKFRIVITVIAVVSLSSSFAFYFYGKYLSEKIYKETKDDTIKFLELINKPEKTFRFTHDSLTYENLAKEILGDDNVSEIYFINSEGKLKFRHNPHNNKIQDTALTEKIKIAKEKITFEYEDKKDGTLSRVFIPLKNKPECYTCHKDSTNNLGYFVFDFSFEKDKENVQFARKYSILFSVFMVFALGIFVLLMHYRFVRGSLKKFQKSISIINQGNLDERVPIVDSKELGELATCFNNMLDKFQETRKELSNYHEKELQNAQRLATIGEMSARLAHEIRNPVMGIANAIEIIAEDTRNEQNKQILREVKRQTNRVYEAVSKLLRYSKTQNLNLKKQNINELIKSVVFFLQNQASTEKITFVLELDTKIPEFNFDAEKVETAIINLSLNAIQAIENKGNIIFKTKFLKDKNLAEISVSDNGKGIPEDKINDIFKPFYTTKTEGTGLGMSIIKETAESHGGSVTVKSEVNKGTTVILNLPVK